MRTNTKNNCPVCGRQLWQTEWKPRGNPNLRYAVQYCERRRDNATRPLPQWITVFAKDPHELADLGGTHFYRVLAQKLTLFGWIDDDHYRKIVAVLLAAATIALALGFLWAVVLVIEKLHGA